MGEMLRKSILFIARQFTKTSFPNVTFNSKNTTYKQFFFKNDYFSSLFSYLCQRNDIS